MLHAGYTLGSQADAPVLVDQPLAVITQKAKVKRDRRTEWEYYVQFPDFPESEGQWYSARNILAQHKCGAQLIREFEGGGDAPDSRLQQAQQAMPLTQDAGPSQIGSFSAASIPSSTQHNQMYTQEQAPSQMHQQESAPAGNQSGGLSAGQMAMARAYQPSDSNALQTVNQQQPPLYWSFERLQQAQTGALHSLPNQGMHAEHQYTHQPQRLMAGLAQVSQPLARQLHPASHAAMPPALHAGTQPLSRDLVQQQQQWQQNHQRHPYQQQSHQQYPHQQPHQQQQIHHQHPLQQQPQQQQTRQEDSVGVSTVHLTQAYPSALTGAEFPAANTHGPHAMLHASAIRPQAHVHPRLAYPGAQLANPAQPTALPHQTQNLPTAAAAQHQHLPTAAVGVLHQQPVVPSASQGMVADAVQQVHKGVATKSGQQHQSPPANAVTRVVNLSSSPSKQANADGHVGRQKAGQPLQSLTNDLTSHILGQHANQLRHMQHKKGTALLDLVPTVKQQMQSKAANMTSTSKQAEPHSTQAQPLRAEQHCEAFIPAVQQCIQDSGQMLCKPFCQQTVPPPAQHATPHSTAIASVQALHSPLKPTAQQSEQQHANAVQPAGHFNQGVGTTASAQPDDLFLGAGQRSREEVETANRHIAEDLWATAVIGGARRVQDNLELHVKWSDGFDTWLSLEALKKRQHCKTDIIDFLVSKVRKKSKN